MNTCQNNLLSHTKPNQIYLNKINKGSNLVKIPKNAQGTLTRKLYNDGEKKIAQKFLKLTQVF